MPVDFLSTVDTTGGNSGSPTLNGKGEFVGLLFDGTYDTIASDFLFDTVNTRSIHADVRYMLWVMSEVDGAVPPHPGDGDPVAVIPRAFREPGPRDPPSLRSRVPRRPTPPGRLGTTVTPSGRSPGGPSSGRRPTRAATFARANAKAAGVGGSQLAKASLVDALLEAQHRRRRPRPSAIVPEAPDRISEPT